MNNIILCGRLTKEPEVKTVKDGLKIASFTLAIDRPVKKGSTKETDFIRITTFGKLADIAEKYLEKGKYALIRGRIQTGSYKKEDGSTTYTTDVIAEEIKLI